MSEKWHRYRDRWAAYAVKVERMRTADRERGDRDLNSRVRRKTEHTALRQEVLGILRAAEDLEKDRHIGRYEGSAIDREVRGALQAHISATPTSDKDGECSRSRCRGLAHSQRLRVLDFPAERASPRQ